MLSTRELDGHRAAAAVVVRIALSDQALKWAFRPPNDNLSLVSLVEVLSVASRSKVCANLLFVAFIMHPKCRQRLNPVT